MVAQVTPSPAIHVLAADYANAAHAAALVDMLNHYASDPAGGGEPLSSEARQNLVPELAARPQAFSVLAFHGQLAVGLVNCIEGFSTFKARPLVNVHDVAVRSGYRGQGIAGMMLSLAESMARERKACKLTLEVLEGNRSAQRLYATLGYVPYQLDPAMGAAQFLQKWL